MRSILYFLCITCVTIAKAQPAETYYPGYYYTITSTKIAGFFMADPTLNVITFRESEMSKDRKIAISSIKSIVIVRNDIADSLCVLTENNNAQKAYLGKFAFATHVTRFYYKFKEAHSYSGPAITFAESPKPVVVQHDRNYSSEFDWSFSSVNNAVTRTLMYEDGGTTYKVTKKNYIEVFNKAFADNPAMLEKITTKILN